MSTLDEKKGRLFRTLVVMGGTLAVSCGGVAQESAPDEGTGTGAAPGVGGTDGSTGGSVSTGGVLSTGGSLASTGGTPTGGVITLPDTITPGPFVCPPEQWDCGAGPYQCGHNEHLGYSLALPGNCTCDPEKPLAPSDCGEGERLVCGEAVVDSEGRRFDRTVNFDCRCEANAEDCSVCSRFETAEGTSCNWPDPAVPADPIFCDCALPVLK